MAAVLTLLFVVPIGIMLWILVMGMLIDILEITSPELHRRLFK